MATIALSCPTVGPEETPVGGGYCYIMFSEPTIMVGELIAEKVRAEMRKIRAGGVWASNLDVLTGYPFTGGNTGPLDEQLAIKTAARRFETGDWFLLVDGKRYLHLEETIVLTRHTGIKFCGFPYSSTLEVPAIVEDAIKNLLRDGRRLAWDHGQYAVVTGEDDWEGLGTDSLAEILKPFIEGR